MTCRIGADLTSWHRSSADILVQPCLGGRQMCGKTALSGRMLPCTCPASRLVVVDDAGHFGGSMGEQFTAAIDAMADELCPA